MDLLLVRDFLHLLLAEYSILEDFVPLGSNHIRNMWFLRQVGVGARCCLSLYLPFRTWGRPFSGASASLGRFWIAFGASPTHAVGDSAGTPRSNIHDKHRPRRLFRGYRFGRDVVSFPDTTNGTAVNADQLGWFWGSMGRHIRQSHGSSCLGLRDFLTKEPFVLGFTMCFAWILGEEHGVVVVSMGQEDRDRSLRSPQTWMESRQTWSPKARLHLESQVFHEIPANGCKWSENPWEIWNHWRAT